MKKAFILLACMSTSVQLSADPYHYTRKSIITCFITGSLTIAGFSLLAQKYKLSKYKEQKELDKTLFEAVYSNNARMFRLALSAGANPNARDISGVSILQEVATKDQVDLVKELIMRGVDIHSCDNRGITAAQHAADRGRVEVVKLLVEAGAPQEFLYRAIKQIANEESRKEFLDQNEHFAAKV